MSLPLYRRVLGPAFDVLPARVRQLHDLAGVSVWVGRASVERGRSLPSRIAAALTGLPPEGPDQPLSVTFEPSGTTEVWLRQFGSALGSTQYGLYNQLINGHAYYLQREYSNARSGCVLTGT